jgi:hypothetical protein
MKHFILFLAIMSGAASVLFAAAAEKAGSGAYWAGKICTAAGALCERPLSLGLAAAALMALWIMLAVTSSFGI